MYHMFTQNNVNFRSILSRDSAHTWDTKICVGSLVFFFGWRLKMCFVLSVKIIELSKLGRLLFAKFRLLVKFRPTWLNLESTLSSVIIIYGYTWS